MSLIKTLGRNETVRTLACWLGAQWIRTIHATSRWEVQGAEHPERFWQEGKPFILAFWHGRLLMMPYVWRRGVPMNMLISQHRDGELITRTIAHFDLGAIRGSANKPKTTPGGASKSKSGISALRTITRTLAAGECVGITPDGPRGPRMRARDGIAAIARLSGVPVLPAAYAVKEGRVLGTWDRFLLPRPFTRGVFVWGEPLWIDKADGDMEGAVARIEAALNDVSARADRHMGRTPIEPAPVDGEGQIEAREDARPDGVLARGGDTS